MRKNQMNEADQTNTSQEGQQAKDQNDFIMLPTVDFCFKELMQNEKVRKGMIAAILHVRPDEVERADLMPTILRKNSEDDKYGVLDVRVGLKTGVQIDFEMQVVYVKYWMNRTIYYLGKMYTEQIKEGEGYENLQKCIQVSILDHVYFQEDEKCYRRIVFCDAEDGREYTDLLEMHILELAKLPQEQKNETDLMQWMRFLGGKCREDFKKMAEKKEEFAEAYKELDRLSADEKKRLLYEARQKAIRDRDILITTGREEGREEGRKEGREEGREEGIRAIIEVCQDFGMSKENIKNKLQEKFELTEEQAFRYIDSCWKK